MLPTMCTPSRLVVLAIVLFSAPPARAQEGGQFGITVAYPAAIGVIWQVSDKFAVRPDLSFSQSGSDSGSLFAVDSNTTSTVGAIGISGLFYVRKWEALRAYVSPRFGYQRSSSITEPASLSTVPTTGVYSGTGSFGVQYLLHKRFAMFGETGVGYSRSSRTITVTQFPPLPIPIPGFPTSLPVSPATPVITTTISTSHTWGTHAGVGLIFYF